MTACWSTSKTNAKHPYYMCFKARCSQYRKSIRRDRMEGAFAELLAQLTPSPKLFALARAMFTEAWTQRSTQARAMSLSWERELADVDKQINALLDRIVDATSQTVVAAYEKRIGELERSKIVLTEKHDHTSQTRGTFEDVFELAFSFLANPQKLWESGRLEYQRLVLRLTFADNLAYAPETGFRTPKTTLPFNMLGSANMPDSKMAEREGLSVKFAITY